jgi:ADP-dependent NAD(P)H-hydrate dehydratase / NAD(P)H-hydrate epimerase
MTAVHTLNYDSLKQLLAPRARDTHKGDYGHVLVIGGDHGFGGAALMAAEAAARCGAGLTSVATRAEHASALLSRRPELMVRGIVTGDELAELLQRASVLIVGPGLGQSAWSRDCLSQALIMAAKRELWVVLDADALNWLASDKSLDPKGFGGKCILTPHSGEAARLLGKSRDQIDADRPAAALALQQRYGGAVVLKGPGTLICYPQSGRTQLAMCAHGNAGMASGGMGDVLSGALGALLAQHFSLADSVRIGVCVHSKAADLAAAECGERGLLATDLLPYMHRLLNP